MTLFELGEASGSALRNACKIDLSGSQYPGRGIP